MEIGGYICQGGHYIYAEEKFIEYIYGVDGVIGFRLNGVSYRYLKNLQGDVVSIHSNDGKCVAEYKYDAWGNCEIASNVDGIAELNAIRYRSYYFDTETGLYYMTTRYYDPETGRFISPDSIDNIHPEHINGLNLYVYCANNPVMYTDPTGECWFCKAVGWVAVAAVAVASVALIVVTAGAATPLAIMGMAAGTGALFGMGASVIGQAIQGNGINPWQVAFNGVIGGASGALMASPLGWLATGAAVGGLGFVGSVGNDLFDNGGNWSQVNWGRAALIGGVSGLIAGGGKYIAANSKLMPLFTKSSKAVEQASTLSRVLGNTTSLGRTAYQQFWSTAFRVQSLRIFTIANLLRGGSTLGINSIW